MSKAFVEAWKSGQPKSFEVLEAELLNGQKLQGVQTSDEVQEILRIRGWEQVCTGVGLVDALPTSALCLCHRYAACIAVCATPEWVSLPLTCVPHPLACLPHPYQDYPLFTTVNRIVHGQIDPSYAVKYLQGAKAVLPPPLEAPQQPEQPADPAAPKKPRFAPLLLTL